MIYPEKKLMLDVDNTLATQVAAQRQLAVESQSVWAKKPLQERLRIVGRLANLIARDHDRLADLIARPNASVADKLSAEIIPLADACRYTARRGSQVLATRSLPSRDCPWWLGRIGASVHREPWGVVLIIAPSNYPLFLPGVQLVQAIAAGNAVLLKPAPGCGEVVLHLVNLLAEGGMTAGLVQILPASIEAASAAISIGIDKVVLTGSSATGRAVSELLVEHLTPATMELSGCDPVFVLPDADLARVADALAFGVRLNGGATCIAPRRVFVSQRAQATLEALLLVRLADCPPSEIHPNSWPTFVSAVQQAIEGGARMVLAAEPKAWTGHRTGPVVLANVSPHMRIAQLDLFAPVLSLIEASNMNVALELNQACPYALSASIFGSQAAAEHWSRFINAGCVTINDLIVPTADPRVAFGGRRESGYGVTRGLDGLLEMTRPKFVCTRTGNWLPHLRPPTKALERTLVGLLRLSHGASIRDRVAGLSQLIRSLRLTR